jgi:hypothetical protein
MCAETSEQLAASNLQGALKMKVGRFSETILGNSQSPEHHIPEILNLLQSCYENIRPLTKH